MCIWGAGEDKNQPNNNQKYPLKCVLSQTIYEKIIILDYIKQKK